MRVWLITVGEPLPTDDSGDRLLRTGQLASRLVSEGHEVVWWSSTFDHARKELRFKSDTCMDVSVHYRIWLLHSCVTYRRNVSVARLVNHSILASRFVRLAYGEPKPDIILCSLPTLELSQAATAYGQVNGVPVVIDARDMWPDVFLEPVPEFVRPLARLALRPFKTMAHRACSGATALVGITPHFVDWALGYAGRTRSPLDRDFPLAYPEPTFSEAALSSAIERWGTRGVTKDKFVVCFLGTFGAKQFLDMETVIGAARVLSGRDREILFVLCGTGVGLDYCRSRAADCSNVLFPGWVGAADIWALMRLASVGLVPYQSSPSFVVSIPNKAIEYLCGGLPVVSSLRGSLDELLSVNRCGVTYGNGDAQGLATLLAGLSEHPERVSDMSANARAVHESRFNAERVYGEFADHLVGIGTMPRSSSRSQ